MEKPNILWISNHDSSAWNFGCYGDEYGHTPNIDRLAAEGVQYSNAFTAGPICSPSRTSIYTGMYPTTLGTHHHRSIVIRPKGVKLLSKILTDAGYICTEPDSDINLYISREECQQYQGFSDFWEASNEKKPFFSYYKLNDSHASVFKLKPTDAREQRSSLLEDEELHDPKDVPVPTFVPDTALFRERMALFYDALSNVDKRVGTILNKLEELKLNENTIVVFWADHGTGYPRGKIHTYDDGLRIPLIIRFPEKFQHLAPALPGTVIDELVLHMDLYATTLQFAGVPISGCIQSRNLCGPHKDEPRDFVCSARDRLDNNPEMIRTIRTKKYRYIRNFLPHQPYASFYPDGGYFSPIPEEDTPERDFWETSCLPSQQRIHDPDGVFLMYSFPSMLNGHGLPKKYQKYPIWQARKPFEELYDIENDPESIHNLVGDPTLNNTIDELRSKLFDWMIEIEDLGLIDETEIIVRASAYDGINREVGIHCTNFSRILETADLARLGTVGQQELITRLEDSDSAVRYWAVTGLSSYQFDLYTINQILPCLDDESISVSLAAANYLVRAGKGSETIASFTQGLKSDILWARIRAGAYLSYCSRSQLRPMAPLIPVLQKAIKKETILGPEHEHYIQVDQFPGMLNSQRDVIGNEWVLNRVMKRIQLATDEKI